MNDINKKIFEETVLEKLDSIEYKIELLFSELDYLNRKVIEENESEY